MDDIQAFVSQCNSCQMHKFPYVSASALPPLPVPTACWHVVSLGMISQLPRTADGFDCIVVFVDQFSKMVHLAPTVTTLDSAAFGTPLGIRSDRGT